MAIVREVVTHCNISRKKKEEQKSAPFRRVHTLLLNLG